MIDHWRPATLGDAFTLVKAKVSPSDLAQETAYVGLEHIEPGSPRLGVVGRVSDVSSLVTPFLPGDTLFGRLRPYLRKVALAGMAGVCTPEVLVLRPTASVLPGFLHLLASAPSTIEHAVAASAGTRMPRTSPTDLARIEVALPPLEVQRRIVDVVEVVDAHQASLSVEIGALARLLHALLEEWHAQGAAVVGLPLLGDLAVIRSGPSWAAADESAIPSDGATRVIKITNTKQDGSLDLTGRTYVTGLPARTLLLDDRSLIVIRTNGNRDRIGNVYRPSPEAFGCAVSAFQFIVHAADGVARDRIYWALRAPRAQAAMSEAASGSTGLGNLAAGWLKARPIAELDGQSRLAFEDVDRQLDLLRNERDGLGAVRTQLLQALLSREMELPEAYDLLVDAGVA